MGGTGEPERALEFLKLVESFLRKIERAKQVVNRASVVSSNVRASQVDVSRSIGLGSISALQMNALEDPESIAITLHRQRPIPSTVGSIKKANKLSTSYSIDYNWMSLSQMTVDSNYKVILFYNMAFCF